MFPQPFFPFTCSCGRTCTNQNEVGYDGGWACLYCLIPSEEGEPCPLCQTEQDDDLTWIDWCCTTLCDECDAQYGDDWRKLLSEDAPYDELYALRDIAIQWRDSKASTIPLWGEREP